MKGIFLRCFADAHIRYHAVLHFAPLDRRRHTGERLFTVDQGNRANRGMQFCEKQMNQNGSRGIVSTKSSVDLHTRPKAPSHPSHIPTYGRHMCKSVLDYRRREIAEGTMFQF